MSRQARAALVLAVALVLPALPSLASSTAGPVTPLVRSALLTAADTVTALTGERLVGVVWSHGPATVALRWHTATGWGAWESAEQDPTEEGLPGTEPQWRPRGADRVEVRTSAPGARLVRVTDGPLHRVLGAVAHAATGRAVLGDVRSRADWGADESLRRHAPTYAARVVAVTVHHTDDANGYAPGDVPAIIRADYAYHVQGRGWNDLGYNLLVDQYGGIWEGRAGGLGRATIGAHAEGFNTGTLGVAMIGDLTRTSASPAAQRALAEVVAYAASTWHFDPTGSVQLTSQGSPRYARGRVVTLPRVFGHGQTGVTDCPASLQGLLPAIGRQAAVALRPAPVVLRATVTGAPVHAPAPVLLDAALAAPAAWTVTFTDATGLVVARATGSGSRPRLSWDGLLAGLPDLPGTVTWAVTADDGFHAAVRRTGTFAVGLPLL